MNVVSKHTAAAAAAVAAYLNAHSLISSVWNSTIYFGISIAVENSREQKRKK